MPSIHHALHCSSATFYSRDSPGKKEFTSFGTASLLYRARSQVASRATSLRRFIPTPPFLAFLLNSHALGHALPLYHLMTREQKVVKIGATFSSRCRRYDGERRKTIQSLLIHPTKVATSFEQSAAD